MRGDEVDGALGFRLVPVLVDPEIVFAEPFLEPVRLLRLESLRHRGIGIEGDHL